MIDRPGLFVNVPSLVDPSLAPAGTGTCCRSRCCSPRTPIPGGWAASTEPQRWLELVAGLCENDLLGSIEAHRVMTPDVYEREFNLPRGHATSFGGGPLAALRNPDPELTRYETMVPGLYLTGAATFPGAGIWGASGRNCATVVLAQTALIGWVLRTPGGRSPGGPRFLGRVASVDWNDFHAARFVSRRPHARHGCAHPLDRARVAALLGVVLVGDLGVVVGSARRGQLLRGDPAARGRPRHGVQALRHRDHRRSSCGASAAWPDSRRSRRRPQADGWIAAAGPLSNAARRRRCRPCGVAARPGGGSTSDIVISLAWFAAVNLALAAFNVLPGAPLDGGRIFRACAGRRHGQRYQAMREAAILGNILGWGLVAFGVSLMINGRSGIWILVSGVFIVVSARVDATVGADRRAARVGQGQRVHVVRRRRGRPGHGRRLDAVAAHPPRRGRRRARCAARRARSTGSSSRTRCGRYRPTSRPLTMLTQLMAPLDRLPRADVDDDLATVLPIGEPAAPDRSPSGATAACMGVVPPKVIRERIRTLVERPAF